MGAGASKDRLSKADMEFLLLHTHYDEKTIQGMHFMNLWLLMQNCFYIFYILVCFIKSGNLL